MKKQITFLVAILATTFMVAQVPTIDFETVGDVTYVDGENTGTVTLVTDAGTNGTNVIKLETDDQSNGGNLYSSYTVQLDNRIDLSDASARTLSFDFQDPEGLAREILLKISDPITDVDNFPAYEFQLTSQATTDWQTLDFHFQEFDTGVDDGNMGTIKVKPRASYPNNEDASWDGTVSGNYSILEIFIDFASGPASTTHVDNFRGGLNGGANVPVGGPTVKAPTPAPVDVNGAPLDIEHVLSVFSDHYDGGAADTYPTLNWQDWGGGSIFSTIEVDGDEVWKASNMNYFGQTFDAVDLNNYSHVHIDAWVDDLTHEWVDFYLITPGTGESPGRVNFTGTGQWVSIDIPLTEYTVPDLSNISQFKWATGGERGTIYIDNVYFFQNNPSNDTEVVFTVDANASPYPGVDQELRINSNANATNDWGSYVSTTLLDDGVGNDVTAGDGIYSGSFIVDKTVVTSFEYVVAIGDDFDDWIDKSQQSSDCGGVASDQNFAVTLGAEAAAKVTEALTLLDTTPDPANNIGDGDDSNNISWACYSSDASVDVTIIIRGFYPGQTYGQYGLTTPGGSNYALGAALDNGEGADETAGDGVLTASVSVPFYSEFAYEPHFNNDQPGFQWDGLAHLTKNADTNDSFRISVDDDPTPLIEDLSTLNAADENGNFLVYTETLTNKLNGEVTVFKVYPNPTRNNWMINASSNINSVEVYNVLGKQVLALEVNSNKVVLSGAALNNGIYFARVNAENGSKTLKLVKN